MNPDETKPSPHAQDTPANAGETVAPDVSKPDLVLRKVEDLLRENKLTPDQLKEMDMTKEEVEQFVQKYKSPPRREPGKAREIEVTPGRSKNLAPDRKGPEFNPGSTFSSRSDRAPGSVAQDDMKGLNQGTRSEAPPEIRSRWEAYKSSISRTAAPRPSPSGGRGGK